MKHVTVTTHSDTAIKAAAAALAEGELVVFPTETVYGLAARADNAAALSRIYAAKQRPAEKPLAYHVGSWNMFHRIAGTVEDTIQTVLSAYWPGPVTFLLRIQETTHGFRFPSHYVARDVLQMCGVPVMATSANISGAPSPVKAEDTMALAEHVAYILDAGPTPLQGDSTLVDLTGDTPRCLRHGVGDWHGVPSHKAN